MSALPTVYVDGEGPGFLDRCMAAAFDFCKASEIHVLVIFTSSGEGPCKALDDYLSKTEFSAVRLVAVTPPANRFYRDSFGRSVQAGITGDRFRKLRDAEIPIVSARLPFRPLVAHPDPLDPDMIVPPSPSFDPMHSVDRALGMFGGGLSLCIQAVLMACDAGVVAAGESVVVMSADTAVSVSHACQSESFLSPVTGMIVDHIICRPRRYTISKRHHTMTHDDDEEEGDDVDVVLPVGADVPKLPAGPAGTESK